MFSAASLVAFLLKSWRWFAIGGLVAALGFTSFRLHHAKADLSEARAALTNPRTHHTWQADFLRTDQDRMTCVGNLADATATLDTQSTAVASWKADSDRRAKMMADGLQQARKGKADVEARAASLLKNPPVGADACARSEAAMQAVLGALK